MRNAVIVSTARTPIGKAYRGAFNDTQAQTLAAHAVSNAVQRAGVTPDEIEDVVLGAALQQGSTHMNVARQAAIRAGLPTSVPGMTVDRQCSSGLMALSIVANQVRLGEIDVGVAGGVESVSLVQTPRMNVDRLVDPWIEAHRPDVYMTMLETAEIVAARYGVSRETQDEYAVESHRRTATAQAEGRFDVEIAPLSTVMKVKNRDTGEVSDREVTLEADEGVRPSTTLEGLQALQPVFKDGQQIAEGRFITAGNASQLSDGASAMVVMGADEAERRGLTPLGALRGVAVAGCDPEEMGIGPVFAVPKLLSAHGLTVDDIDLWELNEAFASQVLYCRDRLGIDPQKYNVSGGSIAVGHPYGMTGARLAGHLLVEGHRRAAKLGVVSMCIGGGMGAAGLFEIY
jgi:acetyl-CoA C-acetyltransferase